MTEKRIVLVDTSVWAASPRADGRYDECEVLHENSDGSIYVARLISHDTITVRPGLWKEKA